ncbi:signal transduction histidine kinase LytS [Nitritalea halalkaliphila LW7]|uniref:Signal transduction histidine kinase LytS n=1 Tax=Nitritalea halalkaliphila LW7 TaxID=1189621 RepID=I5C5I0_9BACT|nr:tetratricopeptide repeat protein [Nitritalea halalkaliphila]EIM77082.1 signal transduction histidine kinase LytS [Nitritalea halalkaliphila LW7]
MLCCYWISFGPLAARQNPSPEREEYRALIDSAEQLQRAGDYTLAIQTCEQAYRGTADQAFLQDLRAEAAMRIGSLYAWQSQMEQALQYLLEASTLFTALDDGMMAARTLNNIAAIYQELDDLKQAEEYLKKALAFMNRLNHLPGIAVISGNLGNLYARLERFEEAKDFLNRAYELQVSLENPVGQAYSLNYLGGVFEKEGRTQEAIANYELALQIEEEIGEHFLMMHSYFNLAQLYQLEAATYALAESYYAQAAEKALQIGSPKMGLRILDAQAALAALRGDFQLAYALSTRSREEADSLALLERNEQVAEMQAKFDLSQKETEILALSQANEIQQLQLARRNTLLAGGLGTLLLLLIAGYTYTSKKSLESRIVQLDAEQRWRRGQMNPHFLFNALNALRSVVLQERVADADSYLNAFSQLMRKALDASEQEFIDLEEELQFLQHYVQLQQLRFPGHFRYEVDVAAELQHLGVRLPVMLLQPLLENAIEHGLRHRAPGGHLTLRILPKVAGATDEGAPIRIEVEDDGIGRAASAALYAQQVRGHVSKATGIIKERIELMRERNAFPIVYAVEDLHADGTGTLVCLDMPLKTF